MKESGDGREMEGREKAGLARESVSQIDRRLRNPSSGIAKGVEGEIYEILRDNNLIRRVS